tara:strand:+ start:1078 stop:2307 length:1230 start_codon:yes stop_codon:yes gene_type:complete
MDNKDLQEYTNSLCEYYVDNFPLNMQYEKYEQMIVNEIFQELSVFEDNLNIKKTKEKILEFVIEYLKNNYVMRCYGNTYLTYNEITDEIINEINKKLQYLKNVPQPEQRTNEWYNFRHNHLTASNLWKVFGTTSSINQLIYEKCLPINPEKYKSGFTETPMSWGHKYEDVSIMLYEKRYNTKIRDYGCVPHIKYEFIAASPDGINDDCNSPLYGRMLEIKNIVNRKITGIPKKEYWVQMQLQMEVCDLDECDFLETRFKEYESYEEFMEDGDFKYTKDNMEKGVIIYIKDNINECPHYEYMPINYTFEEYKKWEEYILEKYNNNNNYEWLKNIYWRLDQVSCVLVKRNTYWFKEAYPELEKTWNIILKEREDNSYTKRAPKKREKKESIIENNNNNKNNNINNILVVLN